MTDLEQQVEDLQKQLDELRKRVRLDAVAKAYVDGDHAIREGDYFLAYKQHPTKLYNADGARWHFHDGNRSVERDVAVTDHVRLYTIAEVGEIISQTISAQSTADGSALHQQIDAAARVLVSVNRGDTDFSLAEIRTLARGLTIALDGFRAPK